MNTSPVLAEGSAKDPVVVAYYSDLQQGLWQADCDRCGWHTRQADSKRWVNEMAALHRKTCPAPNLEVPDIPIEAVIAGVDAFHAYSRQSGYGPYPISDGQVTAILSSYFTSKNLSTREKRTK